MQTLPLRHATPLIIVITGLMLTIAGIGLWRWRGRPYKVLETRAASTSQTASPSQPATATAKPEQEATYVDVVRKTYSQYPATQALPVPVELKQAAHLLIDDPVYLGGQGRPEMWITRTDAPPIEQVLRDAVDEEKDLDAHVLRQRAVFVHWMPDAQGTWAPTVICRGDGDGYSAYSPAGRQEIPKGHDFRWNEAMSWNDKIIAPSSTGVSVLTLGQQISESHHDLAGPSSATSPAERGPVRYLLDGQGLLCWMAWEGNKAGGSGAARYVDGWVDDAGVRSPAKWSNLSPTDGWPQKILHMVPLLDGTVLMLTVDDDGAVQLQFNTLEHAAVKAADIEALVDQLSDSDQAVRDGAYARLSQYGSGVWGILEKLLPDQGPEAQMRLKLLLKQKVTPSLNGMTLLGGKSLKVASRLWDGGAVFFAEAGVSIPNPDDPDAGPTFCVPAWISIRPGRPIELLPQALTAELTSADSRLYANGSDWIVAGDSRGARRFVGNGFVTVQRKSERGYTELIGVDRRGRWLFHQPAANATTADSPSTSTSAAASTPTTTVVATDPSHTLVIDPTLPNPRPRLPVWVLANGDETGWTRDGWPVTKKNSAYALREQGWQLVNEDEKIFTKAEDAPPPVELPATQPAAAATGPGPQSSASAVAIVTSAPTTFPATATAPAAEDGTPILTDADGTRYFGGLDDLRLIDRKGYHSRWPLPANAVGSGPAWLVRTHNGRLFLFNEPGRVLRLLPTPKSAAPFKVEATFTHHVPSVKTPNRIWLDPGGRIDMVWDNQLAVFFPDGYIPQSISELMMLNADDEMDGE